MFPIRAVEDDHVDRPGVEVRQRMKLTGTNSSIGLIVLIDYAHLPANAPHSSGSMMLTFVLALLRLCRFTPDGPRHKARRPLGLAQLTLRCPQKGKTCSKKGCENIRQLLTQVALR